MLVLGAVGLLLPLAAQGWRLSLFAVGLLGFSFSVVLYNVAQLSYRQAICPPELLGRMNAAVRWIVWGALPLGSLAGGALGTLIGVRPALWVGMIGSWAAGFWVLFSPLRRMRDVSAGPETAGTAPGEPWLGEPGLGEPPPGRVVLGQGQAIPDVEEQIMRLLPGQSAEADVTFPDDFADETKRGQRRRVQITVHEVKRQNLPPLDDAFAREIGDFDSLAAARQAVRADLEQEARREGDAGVRRQLIEQIVAANKLEAPRPLVERLLATYAQAYEIPDERLEKFAAEFRLLAEAQVRRDLVLDFVAEQQQLKATEDELDHRVAELARRRNADQAQLYASLQKAGRLKDLERQITEEKVFAYLLQQSTVTEA